MENFLFSTFENATLGKYVETGGFYFRKFFYSALKRNLFGFPLSVQHTIGPSHHMISGKMIVLSESWPVAWSFSLPQCSIESGVQELMDFIKQNSITFPHIGVIFRLMPVEDIGILSHLNAGGPFKEGEVCLSVDITRLGTINLDATVLQNRYNQFTELLKIMIEKYQGLNHTTKNLSTLYRFQRDHSPDWQDRLKQFNRTLKKLDPTGIFKNHFADSLGLKY